MFGLGPRWRWPTCFAKWAIHGRDAAAVSFPSRRFKPGFAGAMDQRWSFGRCSVHENLLSFESITIVLIVRIAPKQNTFECAPQSSAVRFMHPIGNTLILCGDHLLFAMQ
jgi:hypothetical protein